MHLRKTLSSEVSSCGHLAFVLTEAVLGCEMDRLNQTDGIQTFPQFTLTRPTPRTR